MDVNCLLCLNTIIKGGVPNTQDDQHHQPMVVDQIVGQVLQLHFKWFESLPESINGDHLQICSLCWIKVQSFHEFHQSVQHHYRNPIDAIKLEEAIADNEDLDDNRSNSASPISISDRIVSAKSIKQTESTDEDYEPEATSIISIISDNEEKANKPATTKRRAEAPEIDEYFDMKCDRCDCLFNSMKDASQHYRRHHNLKGYLMCCGRKFRSTVKVLEHCAWHRDPTLFDCTLCAGKFQSKCALAKHCDSQHTSNEDRPYRCEVCPKSFGKKHLLTFHHRMMHAAHDDKKFECYICQRRYVYMSLLQNHLRTTHNSEPTHICDVCAKSFKSALSYEHHYEVEHSQVAQKAQCEQCGKWLKHARSLTRHMESHHSVQQTCEVCGHISPGKRALYVHIRTMHHAPRHKCFVCDRLFRKSNNLKEHMAIHQNIRDLYKCPWCPMSCRSSANMSKHRRSVHAVEHMADKANPVAKALC